MLPAIAPGQCDIVFIAGQKAKKKSIMEIMMKSAIDKKIEMVCKKYRNIPKVVQGLFDFIVMRVLLNSLLVSSRWSELSTRRHMLKCVHL